MSFSSRVKNELCRMDINQECCLFSELSGVIEVGVVESQALNKDANIRIVTENAAFARRIFTTIKKLYDIHPEIIIRKNNKFKKHVSYILVITSSFGGMGIKKNNISNKNCCRRSFLRGAFLAGGSISDPEKTYHLEITSHNEAAADRVCETAVSFGLNAKVVVRKGNYITYLKEGENLVDFLNIVGAHSALLELENIRILKGMRNDVNRIVNCETANLEKTVNASVRQIDNIKYIKDNMGLENLPDMLKEIAELRIQYNDANLKELGQMLSYPVGKSGVNHRLRKLDSIAEDLRKLKGE